MVYREHRAWADRHAAALERAAPRPANARDPARRLRIGYVSPYFRKHAVTFFLESVLEHYDRECFDVILYADVAQPDEYSRRLQALVTGWRDTVGMDDAKLAQLVRDDAIDILVDLSGHTPGNRLLAFARRPAPVQVTWNGYPNTTGMDSMGYRITDAYCDPPGATENLHSEKLVRLPGIYMAWRPPCRRARCGAASRARRETRHVRLVQFLLQADASTHRIVVAHPRPRAAIAAAAADHRRRRRRTAHSRVVRAQWNRRATSGRETARHARGISGAAPPGRHRARRLPVSRDDDNLLSHCGWDCRS